jgi:acetamidase/formamidase
MVDSNYIMAFGQAKSLDKALEKGTMNMINWLSKDHQLSIEEASQVVGPVVEFRIPKIASTIVEVMAMIRER